MNKVIAITGVTAMALILTLGVLAPGAIAMGPQVKVFVCHNDDGPDDIRGEGGDDGWEEIEINSHALQKHIDNHPDLEQVGTPKAPGDFEIVTGPDGTLCSALILANPVG